MKQNSNYKKWQIVISLLCLLIAVFVHSAKIKYDIDILFFIVIIHCIIVILGVYLYTQKAEK